MIVPPNRRLQATARWRRLLHIKRLGRAVPELGGVGVGILATYAFLASASRIRNRISSRSLGLILAALGISIFGQPFVLGAAYQISSDREEAFDFEDAGHKGHSLRQVQVVDLGKGVPMELVRVPAGKFQMGSAPGEKDRLEDEVQHSVEITRNFYMGKHEVTRGQFRAFVDATGYRTEAETDGKGGWGYNEDKGVIEGRKTNYTWKVTGFVQTDEHPVINVTWNDANAFCQWLAQRTGKVVRLPTEAEWEYACRAGSATRYYSGNDPESLVRVGNVADGTAKKKFSDWDSTIVAEDGYVFTSPVGKFLPNRFGLCDMLGNVWEWCEDCYGPYADLGAKDPVRKDYVSEKLKGRVMRGGGFGKRTPRNCTATRRVAGAESGRDLDLGFRVCFSN
jgi:formylglycine-generating enzyme required for sulfatase activity